MIKYIYIYEYELINETNCCTEKCRKLLVKLKENELHLVNGYDIFLYLLKPFTLLKQIGNRKICFFLQKKVKQVCLYVGRKF